MEGAGVQKLKKRQFTFVYENTKDSQREPDFNTFILIYIYIHIHFLSPLYHPKILKTYLKTVESECFPGEVVRSCSRRRSKRIQTNPSAEQVQLFATIFRLPN